jgi:hypothetical protein
MAQAAVARQTEEALQPAVAADGRSGALKKSKVVILMPKDGMITITGKEGAPENEILINSDFKVWTVPDDVPVARGRATGSIRLQLGIGRYRIKCKKMQRPTAGSKKAIAFANWGYEFIVGTTEQQLRKLESIPLHWQPSVMTTENAGNEIKCGAPGCENISMTHADAIVHEFQAHFRIDPMTATLEQLEKVQPHQATF